MVAGRKSAAAGDGDEHLGFFEQTVGAQQSEDGVNGAAAGDESACRVARKRK
jgi:hypothetical protein